MALISISFVYSKIKFLIVSFIDLLRYVCCSRKNSGKSNVNFAPLSSIGIVTNDNSLHIINEDDNYFKPMINNPSQNRNVQDQISHYRQQKCRQMSKESNELIHADYFQDMEPKIIRQQKVIINKEEAASCSRLSILPMTEANELTAWEELENTGNWDVDENDTENILREKRRLDRERRAAENMKKRTEKDRNRMASKIS